MNTPRYPLQWPASRPRTPKEQRKDAHFGTMKTVENRGWKTRKRLSISEAVDRVLNELDSYTQTGKPYRVPPDSIVISTNLKYKIDGLPYSNQKNPEDPGAAVYFTLDGKPYCLPCDKWTRIADNLAAIAAHIAANRGIERWGVGQAADVYAGYAALPAAGETTAGRAWWLVLDVPQDCSYRELEVAKRRCLKKVHPDVGGSAAAFIEVMDAFDQAIKEKFSA